MPGRLNSFQRTMLHWNDQHPYNAVHVAKVAGTPDVPRIQQAVHRVLQRRGLTEIELDPRRKSFRYLPASPSHVIEAPPPADDPDHALVETIRRQLNTPFPGTGRFCPLRFFVVPAGSTFWLGLAYLHAVADAESIVHLLRELVHACGHDSAAPPPPPDLYPPRFDNLLRRPLVLLRKLACLPGSFCNMRRSIRPPCGNLRDGSLGFRLVELPTTGLQGLLGLSKSWHVTVNDLLLTLMLAALAPIAASRRKHHRQAISVASIVNLRRDLGLDGPNPFGQFLGAFFVTSQVPANPDLRTLASSVCLQTRRAKQWRLPLAFPLDLATARLALRFFSPGRRPRFYQKNRPLWGGITNMNLNSIGTQPGSQLPLDYLRAVGTGPGTPLVLSVTTAGDSAHLGLSYRTTVFDEPTMDRFQSSFTSLLANIPQS